MDIKDLQKAWNRMSAETSGKEDLTEEKIRELLSTRTANLMERIDKNIRWGFAILFVILTSMVIWDFFISENSEAGSGTQVSIPEWVTYLDRSINFLIFVLFFVFVIRYQQIRKKCQIVCNLRQALQKVIKVLTTYKRLFSFVLIVFLLSSATAYIAGFFKGIHVDSTSGVSLPVAIISGVVTLGLFTGLLFLLLRWIFRKLYGNYLSQLKETLKELDELE
jgi:hypothetical protein